MLRYRTIDPQGPAPTSLPADLEPATITAITGCWAVEEWEMDGPRPRLLRVRYTINGNTGEWVQIANLTVADRVEALTERVAS